MSARSKVLRHQNRDRLLIECDKLTASRQGASIGALTNCDIRIAAPELFAVRAFMHVFVAASEF